ncbi:MAG: RNA-binding protein [Flavobacteriales bacterium]|nr:MAG: RNA-binding protein [Flavobacteriales bacterium]
MHNYSTYLVAFCLATFFLNCTNPDNIQKENTLFQLLHNDTTGIDFRNDIDDLGDITPYNSYYVYNGGGVAAGDINNDGLCDLFFTGNQVENKLYLNEGNFKFKDITTQAKITDSGWSTGVVMADVNGDGWLDIYVCKSGSKFTKDKRNQLFINNGNNQFSEKAAEFNLADNGHTTHACFFDYDNDGDLDAFILNHPSDFENVYHPYFNFNPKVDSLNSNKLMQNVDGKFVDVTKKSGIMHEKGFGLSISIADVNNDGWLDIYVANDFIVPDYFYINNGDKTFTESRKNYFNKVPLFAMGSDFSDINNDGLLDLFIADMEPEGHFRRKNNDIRFDMTYYYMLNQKFETSQFSRNMLQLQNPNGTFSEIGEFANVARTDWSWATLFADFDNDGWKDLYITNGTKREFHDIDYVMLEFGGDMIKAQKRHNARDLILNMPTVRLQNYIYRNTTESRFEKMMKKWGVDQHVNSQGAVYADLNNDGLMDLVVNNTDTLAFIYQNTGFGAAQNFLKIKLVGNGKNTFGLGTKVWIYSNEKTQFQQMNNIHGFQSSVEPLLHFGLGNAAFIDSVKVVWLSGRRQVLRDVQVNKTFEIKESDALEIQSKTDEPRKTILKKVPFPSKDIFVHYESDFYDFKRDRLIPKMLSREGPKIAVADVNGDGLDDFFIGGASGQPGALYYQSKKGHFTKTIAQPWTKETAYEDMGMLFFDANNNGTPDLYISSGSNELTENSTLLNDGLYFNRGNGDFTYTNDSFPAIEASTSCVKAADFDNDGDYDLFVGGRLISGKYGLAPKSYLLRNDNGTFTDATAEIAPELQNIGMVTDALWTDFNNDGKTDLIICGEWMPITVFENQGGKLKSITTNSELENFNGWWNCLAQSDFDNDGDMDYIAGNWGYNSVLKCSEKEPITLYVNDFDGNGTTDPVLFHYLESRNAPFADRDLFCLQMPKYRNQFLTHRSYAEAEISDIFTEKQLQNSVKREAKTFASSYIENLGNGKFRISPLPLEVQVSCVNAMLVYDFNSDGNADVLLAGNSYSNFYDQGALDASRGLLLSGNGKGSFTPVNFDQSGFSMNKDVRSLALIRNGSSGKMNVLVGVNNDTLQVYELNLVHEPNQ